MSGAKLPNVLEQDYQQRLRTEITRARVPMRFWRQPTGRVPMKAGGYLECAPTGAADLSGVVTTGSGVRLEVEMKGHDTPVGEGQDDWRDNMVRWGCGYARIRYDRALSMQANLDAAVATLRAVVDVAGCLHPDAALYTHPAGGVMCTRCGWRNGGRPREVVRG